jgi:hypothetical protein
MMNVYSTNDYMAYDLYSNEIKPYPDESIYNIDTFVEYRQKYFNKIET